MKNRILAVVGTLQGLLDAYQIPLGGQTEIQFKLAMQELEGVAQGLEVPAEPVAVVEPTPTVDYLEELAQHKAEQEQQAANFAAIGQRLDTQQQVLQGLLELLKAKAEQVAAPEPTATPAPTPEPTPEPAAVATE